MRRQEEAPSRRLEASQLYVAMRQLPSSCEMRGNYFQNTGVLRTLIARVFRVSRGPKASC